ncbi:unnamed protein product [Arctogadus glacialis]
MVNTTAPPMYHSAPIRPPSPRERILQGDTTTLSLNCGPRSAVQKRPLMQDPRSALVQTQSSTESVQTRSRPGPDPVQSSTGPGPDQVQIRSRPAQAPPPGVPVQSRPRPLESQSRAGPIPWSPGPEQHRPRRDQTRSRAAQAPPHGPDHQDLPTRSRQGPALPVQTSPRPRSRGSHILICAPHTEGVSTNRGMSRMAVLSDL